MASPLFKHRRPKAPPAGETGQEALYLRSLCERQVNIQVRLRGGEKVSGWIEYFDEGMLRLTREGQPNLFIYKEQIAAITEVGRRAPRRSRTASGYANGSAQNASSENGSGGDEASS